MWDGADPAQTCQQKKTWVCRHRRTGPSFGGPRTARAAGGRPSLATAHGTRCVGVTAVGAQCRRRRGRARPPPPQRGRRGQTGGGHPLGRVDGARGHGQPPERGGDDPAAVSAASTVRPPSRCIVGARETRGGGRGWGGSAAAERRWPPWQRRRARPGIFLFSFPRIGRFPPPTCPRWLPPHGRASAVFTRTAQLGGPADRPDQPDSLRCRAVPPARAPSPPQHVWVSSWQRLPFHLRGWWAEHGRRRGRRSAASSVHLP